MRIVDTAPHPALADRIDAYWEHGGGARRHRVLPDGCIDFLFDLDAGSAHVVGTMTTAVIVEIAAGKRIFGVRFHPGAAAPYLAELASDLTDRRIPLDAVTTPGASKLADRVANARDRAERERLVQAHLLDPHQRLRAPDARVRRAAALITARRGAVSLREVAAHANIGERQLERLFHAHVGVAPKHYARVARLAHACRLLTAPAPPDAPRQHAALAAQAGYADESHLVRDFHALAGVTPAALRAERGVRPISRAGNPPDWKIPPNLSSYLTPE
jgi:AraC-like DNA-binding protein